MQRNIYNLNGRMLKMKKRLQGLVMGIIIGALMTSGIVFAKNIQETINAVYMNVKLVVDGIEITPKDANGNVVEPFIYNGTTYLPVRAIGEAFDKDVQWDGDTATVYIGGVQKPLKEVYLYDKPYIECGNPFEFKAEEKGTDWYNKDITNYIGFNLNNGEEVKKDNYQFTNYVTYALNGLASKVKGTFKAPKYNIMAYGEYKINFYNESGKLLYQSPIMNPSTSDIDFEFETGKCLSLKIEINALGGYNSNSGFFNCVIEDLAILTTDY